MAEYLLTAHDYFHSVAESVHGLQENGDYLLIDFLHSIHNYILLCIAHRDIATISVTARTIS